MAKVLSLFNLKVKNQFSHGGKVLNFPMLNFPMLHTQKQNKLFKLDKAQLKCQDLMFGIDSVVFH
jgi:hypothetical protein